MKKLLYLLLLVPACFNPTYNRPTCGPGGECPSGLACDGTYCVASKAADASPADTTTDVAIDASPTPCLDRWMAGTVHLTAPALVGPISSASTDRDPFLTADGLQLYFSSNRGAVSGDIWMAARASPAATFSSPTQQTALTTSAEETKVSLTADKLLAVRSADGPGGAGSFDLFQSTRPTPSDPFGAPSGILFVTINDATGQFDPCLNADGTHLYFAAGTPETIRFASRISTTTSFGTPTPLIATGQADADPSISVDERLLVYTSVRAGATHLWYTTRATSTAAFGTSVQVPDVSSANQDVDPALSADGCTLFFASNRSGNYEIYQSTVIL